MDIHAHIAQLKPDFKPQSVKAYATHLATTHNALYGSAEMADTTWLDADTLGTVLMVGAYAPGPGTSSSTVFRSNGMPNRSHCWLLNMLDGLWASFTPVCFGNRSDGAVWCTRETPGNIASALNVADMPAPFM